jgi:hypothetical protein
MMLYSRTHTYNLLSHPYTIFKSLRLVMLIVVGVDGLVVIVVEVGVEVDGLVVVIVVEVGVEVIVVELDGLVVEVKVVEEQVAGVEVEVVEGECPVFFQNDPKLFL